MTNQIPQEWNAYRSWIDDNPAVFRLNLALDEVAPIEGFSYCVRITIELKNPDENGFSTNERPQIYAIEDQILRPLQSDKDILVAVLTARGEVTWYFYSKAPEALQERLSATWDTSMGYTYQVECSEDKQWNFFLKGLYPNIYEKQTIYNREILSTCQENDDQVEVPRPIEHWLYFDTEQDMLSAIEKAAALGFTVYSSEKIVPEEGKEVQEDLGYCLILSKENTPIDIDGDTWDLIDIALDTHGGYDGWETILVKEKSN
ncbi:TIGR01619 family protein [Capnocytophaga granulosa]|uniref:TIGR01619 family protein n=1 Tax=Capnocytophaga granulosa TaxID=45242 RepID=A0A1H2S057_9FLAO|nr:DUF695 domain-containing protein [Capnocytophaga granulosa]EPD30192.1 TIGR01619 family protein [Capnocytophaga granulosa ATCC 51502]SDW24928.1 TIGR01619 family protein [Capnocytophaga granulosa]SUX20411.1 Family of uncharacterised function (DUF695) [Capnocytophaga granulosa]